LLIAVSRATRSGYEPDAPIGLQPVGEREKEARALVTAISKEQY